MADTYRNFREKLLEGEVTCKNNVESYLARAKNKSNLNAFLQLFDESAEAAEKVDSKVKAGTAGKLAGMVLAVKDVIAIKDKRLTCGSKILENFVSVYDATVIERLKSEDVIIVGKTNMDEFAMGSSTEYSAYGPVLNPVDTTRVPGGSSGGSAAAVAAGLCHVALGTDTGGSIRQPASFCGVVGLKPTYGRVSRYGLVAFASSFDVIGPFANSVYDAALILEVLAGHDERDSTSAERAVPSYTSFLDRDVKNFRVGIAKGPDKVGTGIADEVREAIEKQIDILRAAGVEIKEVSMPHLDYTIPTYYILATAEASSNLERYDGARYGYRAKDAEELSEGSYGEDVYVKSRTEGFGAEVKRRIMLGTFVLSAGYYDAYYRKAQKVRRLIKEDFDKAFQDVDAIITPTAPTTAFKFGAKTSDPLQMYLSDIFTVSANLAGIPGISVPVGKDSQSLPIGLQLLGRQFEEETILTLANFIEQWTIR
ncbi:MAG: Asp-tRNA(Asn)/Glu-tRNA(Gln) amidotransferase subunit GatA [Bacteroidetes bacterium]|nr:Asp-tRNA(Asn)/Glu-tRNA(Gln) amidotransferase subunit GatA [Bacteroidota bacterium]MCL5737852.1 Asp-tRNA(Asn)/Glu-tRNA(Gln) amidotransferase subunit GatA [Bacteroidota bacterium]